ncbi:unnamed protein product, partial [Symbiodinium sp. CCMP2456]
MSEVGAPFDTPRKSVRARYPGWEGVNRHLLPRAGPPRQKPGPEPEQTGGPAPNGAKATGGGDDVGKKKRESTATSSRATSASRAKERSDAKETTPKTTDKLSKAKRPNAHHCQILLCCLISALAGPADKENDQPTSRKRRQAAAATETQE